MTNSTPILAPVGPRIRAPYYVMHCGGSGQWSVPAPVMRDDYTSTAAHYREADMPTIIVSSYSGKVSAVNRAAAAAGIEYGTPVSGLEY